MKPDEPDETEGRKLYRARADALASAQMNYGKRRVRVKLDERRTAIEKSILATGRSASETDPAIDVLHRNQERDNKRATAIRKGQPN